MSGDRAWRDGLVGGLIGGALGSGFGKLTRRLCQAVLAVLAIPFGWLGVQVILATGSVRAGVVVALLTPAVLLVLAIWGRGWGERAWLLWSHRRAMEMPVWRGPAPHVLYDWHEPDDLPSGLLCRCGEPRVPGELIYVGESNRVERRNTDDDRQGACWFVPGIVGRMETWPSASQAKMREQQRIVDEHPRENIAHAGTRRRAVRS